jgi:hypothetical protein
MGAALAVKRGEQKLADMPLGMRAEVKNILSSMTEKEIREFAATKHSEIRRPRGRERVRNVRSS